MKVVICSYKGEEKAFSTISKAAEYAGLNPFTVRNYMSRNKTNEYRAKEGDIIKVIR